MVERRRMVTFLSLVVFVIMAGHQVAGSCGFKQTPPFIDSDWVACLKATTVNGKENQCPLGLKLDDAGYCNEDYAGSVCCLLPPKWNLDLEKAQCSGS